MGRYNLLDECWISVIRGDNGRTELVSLKEVFEHAADYYDLAGEMKTQDFAVLRVLLAVLHTVFSRFDADGNPYECIEVDPVHFSQKAVVDEDDVEDYQECLYETWKKIWEGGAFPDVVQKYLEAWRSHFNLFDEEFPFYQVSQSEMDQIAKGGSPFCGKNLNRTISESGNKRALFSPVSVEDEIRNQTSFHQLVRWLITLQGYIGLSDKSTVQGSEKEQRKSKGWLFDLGGVYLKGKNLFETLWLNCQLPMREERYGIQIQIPTWERSSFENVQIYNERKLNNIASLYSSWSRAVSFSQDYKGDEPFLCKIAKLPEIDHVDNFLEPMTCWNKSVQGETKGHFTPKKHRPEVAIWRNFGLLMGLDRDKESYRRPGILRWYDTLVRDVEELYSQRITICAVSMRDDGNATSWVPVDEIIDEIDLESSIATDLTEEGWLLTINCLISETDQKIKNTVVRFLKDIKEIRKYKEEDNTLIQKGKEEFYLRIDGAFRTWLEQLAVKDSKNDQSNRWFQILEKEIKNYATEYIRNATPRDWRGIREEGKPERNIAVAYNRLQRRIYSAFYGEGS